MKRCSTTSRTRLLVFSIAEGGSHLRRPAVIRQHQQLKRSLAGTSNDGCSSNLPLTLPLPIPSSCENESSPPPPLSLGYVAGLQFSSDDTPWSTFQEAYEILQQVDPHVLHEFETDLWNNQRMRFVHATRDISIIDYWIEEQQQQQQCVMNSRNNASQKVVRSLVFNARPQLIQSSIPVEYSTSSDSNNNSSSSNGSSSSNSNNNKSNCRILWEQPPPLVGPTATHLGGLALAVPLWLAAAAAVGSSSFSSSNITSDKSGHHHYCCSSQNNNKNNSNSNSNILSSSKRIMPRVVVLGAGGCTVPSLLSKAGCRSVTAIEPHRDVQQAALQYFGATESNITLLLGTGEDYLKKNDPHNDDTIDVLIIDAEDGGQYSLVAPPETMRTQSFWMDVVGRTLTANAVVAVNVIAETQIERMQFQQLVSEAMPHHHVWCCEVPDIANVSNRHCLLFATPTPTSRSTKDPKQQNNVQARNDDFLEQVKLMLLEFPFVDMPEHWIKEMTAAWTGTS